MSVLAASVLVLLAAIQADPFRDLPFDEALAAAKTEKKVLVVDFHSAGSEASRRLEKLTFGESRVRSFLTDKVVAIRVDFASAKDLAERLDVESAPTILFVNSDGTEIDRYVSYLEPRRFLDQARDTLAGKDAVFRARARIDAGEKDPRVRYELARMLADRGRHSEALEQLLVCFDRGAVDDPSFADVRSTEVLTQIHRLGQVYPDALEQLGQRSEAAAKRILEGRASGTDLDEVILIDEKLGSVDRLMGLYDALSEKPEEADARKRLAPHVVVVLLADRRYAEALECVGDPAAELEGRIAGCAELAKKAGPAAELERCRNQAIWIGAERFEILLGAGEPELAAALVDQILAFDPKAGTYERLMDHAVRAGYSKKAAEIGRRGVKNLVEKADKARLRVALSGLPER